MPVGWFQGRRLAFNDTITSRCGWCAPQNPTASPQPASEGPYSGKVVDFTEDGMVGVRADGWWGDAPLYYIRHEDLIDVVAPAPLRIAAEPDREIE